METNADIFEWEREILRMPDGPEKEAAIRAFEETPIHIDIGPRFWWLRFFALAIVLMGLAAGFSVAIVSLISSLLS